MAKYRIVFAPIAERQLHRQTRVVQLRILTAIAKLADQPDKGKPLRAQLKGMRALRVGDYRIVYTIQRRRVLIEIIRIAHRREVYD